MLTGEDVERARRLAGNVEKWVKLCVVFTTDVAAEPGESRDEAILRDYGLMTQIFMGLATLPQTLSLLADEHKYDRDVVFDGVMDEAVKDYRTIDKTTLVMKLKNVSERIGKWMAEKAEVSK